MAAQVVGNRVSIPSFRTVAAPAAISLPHQFPTHNRNHPIPEQVLSVAGRIQAVVSEQRADERGVHPPTNYQGIFSSWVWESLLPVKRSLHSMEFQDKSLTCMDCGTDFVFTAGEQLFFHDKQFKNEPKRCKFCKAKRTATFGPAGPGAVPVYNKVETRTICPNATKKQRYPSVRARAGRYCAASVFNKPGRSRSQSDRRTRLWHTEPSPSLLRLSRDA